MNIELIAFGKLKEAYLRQAEAEYAKRISAYGNLTITELAEERLPDKPSDKEITAALSAEAEKAAKHIAGRRYVIAMCIEGKKLTSEQLAETLRDIPLSGISSASFIIGSSYGLSDELKKRADLRLSMSGMTFPHQLARIMLLEQIYRAYQITSGGKYHK